MRVRVAALAACAILGAAGSALAQVNENFDSTAVGALPAGWTASGTGTSIPWAVVNDRSFSGSNSVFTNDVATAATQYLQLPAIIAAGPVTLDFWRFMDTENTFDGLTVEASINGGAFANIGLGAWILNGYNNPAMGGAASNINLQPAFTGNFPIWTRGIATIFASSGDSVLLRFNFSSDGSVSRTGAWLDNIVTTTGAGGACCNGAAGTCTVTSAGGCAFAFTAGSSCSAVSCLPANDLCGGAAVLTLDRPVLASNFGANDDYQIPAANPPFTGLVQTTTTAPGRDVVFTYTPAASGNYSFRVTYATISTSNTTTLSNLALYVTNTCPAGSPVSIPAANILGASNRNALTLNASEEVMCLPLVAGTPYWVYVDQLALVNGTNFLVEVNTCTLEAEPNGTTATATPYAMGNSGMEGSLTPTNEVDFFSLGTPATDSRVFALVDANASSSNAVVMRVTTDTDTLEFDSANADGPYGASSSTIAGRALTGVPSYLRISGSSTTTLYEPYRLYAVVQPPIAAATPETEPNDTVEQSNSSGNNYFSGSISALGDTDVYSFNAAAGALIFAALDTDPLRDNTPFNGAMSLVDSTGAVLAYVNDATATSSITSGAGNLAATTPTSPAEALVWRVRTAGTYYIRINTGSVLNTPVVPTGDYLLSISLANNILGNGACCANTGGCSVIASNVCLAPSLFQGVGSACSAGACPNPVIACCSISSGSCVFSNGASCASGSTASGSACSPSPCPTTGACCGSNGVCSLTNAGACAASGIFQGYGVACAAGSTCPSPVVACCNNSSGACAFTSGTVCPAGSSASGTACSPTPCAPTGVCCATLGSCTQIFGGSCPSGTTAGTGTTCATNPCMAPPNICQNFDATPTGMLPANWTAEVINGTSSTGGTCQPSGWSVGNDQSHTSANSIHANNPDRTFSQDVTMPAVAAAGPVTLDLWARWQTENTTGSFFDGWIVEVSINGSAFTNIQATPADPNPWTMGTYSGTISGTFQSQIAGQRAFVGNSGGGATPIWVELTAVIAANAGDVVQFKFRMVTDLSLGCPTNTPPYLGVWLDDICVYNVAVPVSGVCCRGATCTTTITSSAACTASLIGGQAAGAAFPTSASCNTAVISNSPCCYADYNKVGGITVTDIFNFLTDWFAGSPYANVGGTGAPGPLAVQNIFDFLNNWFAGGCAP